GTAAVVRSAGVLSGVSRLWGIAFRHGLAASGRRQALPVDGMGWVLGHRTTPQTAREVTVQASPLMAPAASPSAPYAWRSARLAIVSPTLAHVASGAGKTDRMPPTRK